VRFLIDVNAGGAVSKWLREHNFNVVDVRQRDPRISDEVVLQWANEDKRVLITTDKDFEEMVWREGLSHSGILRLENLQRMERLLLLETVLSQFSNDLITGSIVVAKRTKVRIRRKQE